MLKQLNAEQVYLETAQELDLEKYVEQESLERFKTLIAEFNAFGSLNEKEYPLALKQIKKLVGSRLKLARDWHQHPEILQQPVEAPFFVLGNPRSGTTLMQNLLALDDGHRAPTFWESRNPSPPPGLDPEADALGRKDEDEHVKFILRMAPRLLPSHPYLDEGGMAYAECESLYALDFHMAYTLHFTQVATLTQAAPPADPIAAFQFHKKILQQLQWKTPTKRWVGKGIAHQYNMQTLLQVYPDAHYMWMHRRPEEYLASMFEMLDVWYEPINGSRYKPDPEKMIENLRQAFDSILSSDLLNDPRIYHISFYDMVKNPAEIIAQVYEKAGIPFTDKYRDRIHQWNNDPVNRSDRHGKFNYSLEKYGLSKASIREMFADYYQRFDLYPDN